MVRASPGEDSVTSPRTCSPQIAYGIRYESDDNSRVTSVHPAVFVFFFMSPSVIPCDYDAIELETCCRHKLREEDAIRGVLRGGRGQPLSGSQNKVAGLGPGAFWAPAWPARRPTSQVGNDVRHNWDAADESKAKISSSHPRAASASLNFRAKIQQHTSTASNQDQHRSFRLKAARMAPHVLTLCDGLFCRFGSWTRTDSIS